VAIPGTDFSGPVDTAAAEVRWCAYAWPVAFGNSGTRSFYVDEQGEVWQCDNAGGTYDGLASGPAFDAAFPSDVLGNWPLLDRRGKPSTVKKAVAFTGRDGLTWRRCR